MDANWINHASFMFRSYCLVKIHIIYWFLSPGSKVRIACCKAEVVVDDDTEYAIAGARANTKYRRQSVVVIA